MYDQIPHYPTTDDLAAQRAEFVLDGNEHRPYHFLAQARVERGMAWNHNLGEPSTMRRLRSSDQAGLTHDAAGCHERIYISELPFLRTRTAGDGERWVQALRQGVAS